MTTLDDLIDPYSVAQEMHVFFKKLLYKKHDVEVRQKLRSIQDP